MYVMITQVTAIEIININEGKKEGSFWSFFSDLLFINNRYNKRFSIFYFLRIELSALDFVQVDLFLGKREKFFYSIGAYTCMCGGFCRFII